MEGTEELLRCPDHFVALVRPPHGETIRALKCPAEPDSMMSTRNRWCDRCGARDASWMSGKCDNCYRTVAAQQRTVERESRRAMDIRLGISEAIELAKSQGRADVAEWLREYREGLS